MRVGPVAAIAGEGRLTQHDVGAGCERGEAATEPGVTAEDQRTAVVLDAYRVRRHRVHRGGESDGEVADLTHRAVAHLLESEHLPQRVVGAGLEERRHLVDTTRWNEHRNRRLRRVPVGDVVEEAEEVGGVIRVEVADRHAGEVAGVDHVGQAHERSGPGVEPQSRGG